MPISKQRQCELVFPEARTCPYLYFQVTKLKISKILLRTWV